MRLLDLTPMLQADDLGKTIDWYSSVLGFDVIAKEGDSWCRIARDDVALMFTRNAHWGSPNATATQYFYVEDVIAFWVTIKDRVTAEWGPVETSYGMLEFAIRDPNGYLLSFGQENPKLRKNGRT